jgi:hypothetical protein
MALFGMVWRMETRWNRYVMLGLAVKESVSAPVGGRKMDTIGYLWTPSPRVKPGESRGTQ